MDGGAGEDEFFMDTNDTVTGGTGADIFVTGAYVEETGAPVITDWEDGEDLLAIVVETGATGAVTIEEGAEDDVAEVYVDGQLVAEVVGAYGEIDPSDIQIVEASITADGVGPAAAAA